MDRVNAEYEKWLPIWQKCRDAAAGQETIHAKGEAYLPPLTGQAPEEYRAYKNRALFFNAVGRTIDALSGLVFRKPPVAALPQVMGVFERDADGAGLSLQGFAEGLVEELLQVGRAGILVDYTAGSVQGLTAGQAMELGRRPMLCLYVAEDIVDWRTDQVNNSTMLVHLRLREQISVPDPENPEGWRLIDQVKVLELTQDKPGKGKDPNQPYCRQRIYRRSGPEGNWELHSQVIPLMNGRRLGRIPFVFAGPRDTTPSINKPPLLDLVNVNLSHYTLMADYRHGLHFSGLPTPVITGHTHDPADGELKIGSTAAWVFAEPDAKAFYLEFKGGGLAAVKAELDALESRMALLGARALAHERGAVEAARTAEIHRLGESSLLASLAMSASLALTKALEISRDWLGASGERVNLALNTDYAPQIMGAGELGALVSALQQGAISWDTFVYNLAQGELLPPGRSAEEEKELIGKSAPAGR